MLLWIAYSIYAIFSLIIQKYFIEFFYRVVTDFNQVRPTPLTYHHGKSRKICRLTYPQGVTYLLNRPLVYHDCCNREL